MLLIKKKSLLQLRPNLQLAANTETISFQQIDVLHSENTLQMFGSTIDGRSVSCFINNIPSQAAVDDKFAGSNWIELNAEKYEITNENKRTRCQIEVDIDFDHVTIDKQLRQPTAPFRILSIALEFATGQSPGLISIANVVKCHGKDEPVVRCIFTTSACDSYENSQVLICMDEKSLITQWMEFICTIDPDIITGYNINGFDLTFLQSRINSQEFPKWKQLGRNINRYSQYSVNLLK